MENNIDTEYRPDLVFGENGIPEPRSLAEGIYRVLERRNGEDIALLHVGQKVDLTDYFVICTAKSTTHVRSLVDEVEYRIGLAGFKPDRSEGRGGDGSAWIVIDYGNVMVHIFTREARTFYNLDKLYSDTEKIALPPIEEEEKQD